MCLRALSTSFASDRGRGRRERGCSSVLLLCPIPPRRGGRPTRKSFLARDIFPPSLILFSLPPPMPSRPSPLPLFRAELLHAGLWILPLLKPDLSKPPLSLSLRSAQGTRGQPRILRRGERSFFVSIPPLTSGGARTGQRRATPHCSVIDSWSSDAAFNPRGGGRIKRFSSSEKRNLVSRLQKKKSFLLPSFTIP